MRLFYHKKGQTNKQRIRLTVFAAAMIILIGIPGRVKAQQVPLYSQYMMNGYLLNPAMAGAFGYTSVSLTAREQWLGIPNAPKTHAISFDSRLLKNSYIRRSRKVRSRGGLFSNKRSGRVGIGGYIFNDKNGLIDRTGAQITYSYHLNFDQSQLSFGISGQGYQYKINKDKFNPYDDNDVFLNNLDNAYFVPDANFGVYFISSSFYSGLSVTQLFESTFRIGDNSGNKYDEMLRHYFFTAGYKYDLPGRRAHDITLEPSMLIKTNELLSTQLDFNMKVYYDNTYWGGISYRTGNTVSFLAGVKVDRYYFGYAFDYPLNSLRKYSYGSHEIMITARFGDNNRRYRWLNRY